MTVRQLPLPGKIVKKSNALCRAYWMPKSVWEARIVAILASKIHADDKDFKKYSISVTEILGKHPDGRSREVLLKACKSLTSSVLELPTNDNSFKVSAILSGSEYDSKKGILYLTFSDLMKPHYINLQKNFAELNLFEYLLLPSGYSQRIFELLKSYDDLPEIIISISDLFKMLDVPESFRKDFRNFRIKVLERASKDIKKYTTLEFEWEPLANGNRPVKRGMTTVAVRFVFSATRQKEVDKTKKQANSQKNNRLFLAAVKCKNNHPNGCERNNKTNVCALCGDLLSE